MYNLVQFGASERVSRVNWCIMWFSSGLQNAFRESIGSVQDFRAQSANHLIKFGTSERRAQIIWFSSVLRSAEHKSFDSVRDFRAQSANHLIQFGTSERRAHVFVCIYIYILYMRYQKGQICLLKHVSKYI